MRFAEYGLGARAHYDVVITGAGISATPPASVPTGDALMNRAWSRLIQDLRDDQKALLEPLTKLLRGEYPPIWLEPLAQILLDHTGDFGVVSSIYSDVRTQRFNAVHVGLARLDAKQITVNMDTLLEAAGTDAWHLHGRWDQPDSIISTVQQYSTGLSPPTRHELLRLLEGANVLVVGYSGRDVDVMPVIAESRPALLHWIHHGSRDLAPTAQQLRRDLRGAMEVFQGSAAQVLGTLRPSRVPSPQTIVDGFFPDAFKTIDESRRALAASAIALEVGRSELAVALLEQLRTTGRLEITRRKLIARAYGWAGDHIGALSVLTRPPSDCKTLVAWPRALNEVAAALPFAGRPRLATAIDRGLLVTKADTAARVRLARAAQKSGHIRRANRRISAVCTQEHLHQLIGEHGRVDALDLLADTQKSLGNYRDALASAARAVSLVQYANASQRGSALRRLAEIAHYAGIKNIQISPEGDGRSPATVLDAIYKEARGRSDHRLEFWAAATRADIAALESAESARRWLDLADRAMPQRNGLAATHFELLQIEVAKRWESAADAGIRARKLVAGLRRAASTRTLERLVSQSVLAECEATNGDLSSALGTLHMVVRGASITGMMALEARAVLLRDTILGVDVTVLAAEYSKNGWRREAAAVGVSASELGRLAWPVLL